MTDVLDLSAQLSPHFTLGDLVRTSHRTIDNTPGPEEIARLRILCSDFLEYVYSRFGQLWVSSGFRCKKLNDKIGGAKNSAHLYGCAADFVAIKGTKTTEIVRWIAQSGLAFDQVIDEFSSTSNWVHLGMLRPGFETVPRKQALTMRLGKYTAFEG